MKSPAPAFNRRLVLRRAPALAVALACAMLAPWHALAAGGSPAARAEAPKVTVRSASLPARGLFDGDRLTAAAMARLDALAAEAGDLDVEVVFVAPTGPWRLDGLGSDERQLTPARLQAVRDHLARRGVDARRIYVEDRVDPKAAEPRLDVEFVGRPATQ
ncbi:MAG: hypothetical protein MUF03_10115 [Rubrivivax sp.]|nr:hypothetical protein [Rubrivivax sp.]